MCNRSRLVLVACTFAVAVSSLIGCGDDARREVRRDGAAEADASAPRTAANLIGQACASNEDCGTGSCQTLIQIVNTPYPGGYCTAPCRRDDECGEGAVCVPGLRGRMGSCYLGCSEAEGCEREGYICRVVSGIGRCVPGSKPLADDVAGRECSSEADCGGGANTCAGKLGGVDAPGGYCSQWCAIDSDCGAGGKCINGISIVTISSGTCYRACTAREDCRPEYECRSVSGSEGDPGVCVVASGS